jgi:serine/threonine protein phosphatase PrpC
MVRDDGLAAALREAADPQAVCDRLVDAANHAGGEDNISVLVVWVAPAATASGASRDKR